MSFSVMTNNAANTALEYLTATQGQLTQTQNAINSGLKVATARDNGAIFAIAQNQRAAVAGYTSVINSINNGTSSIDVALSAGQSISDLLIQLKTAALSASDSSLDTASRQALNANFTALRDQITTIVKNAVFNGFNLVDGSTTADHGPGVFRRHAPHHHPGTESEPVWHDRDPDLHGHDLDPGQGFGLGVDHPDLADQRQLGSRKFVVGRREVLHPGDFRPEAVRHADSRVSAIWSTPTWQRKRPAAGPAGSPAAWHPGSVDRQSGAADHSLPVPLSQGMGGRRKRRRPTPTDTDDRKNTASAPGRREQFLVGREERRRLSGTSLFAIFQIARS